MSARQAVLLTLVSYQLVLMAIGLWASRRTHDTADFFLGGRRLGPLVAGISASASSSSAWTLLGVSGAAYAWGLSAIWLFPATVSGFLVNWLWVAPRLMRASRASGAITLTEIVAGPEPGRWRDAIVWTSALIVVVSFVFYVASQFQAAGDAFASTFDLPMETSLLIGGGVVILYTLIGGFWAASVTDTLQGLLMALSAIVLPVTALIAVGGLGELASGLRAVSDPSTAGLFGDAAGPAAVGFVLGILGIGLGYPGQPHVVNRFMALRDERSVRPAAAIAIAWAVLIYAGMLLLGWCGRVLFAGSDRTEQIFFETANGLLPPVAAGVMIAAILSAIMSTADSQLLVAGSSISHDLGRGGQGRWALRASRIVVLAISVLAILLALFLPDAIFSRVLFAWHAVGSAFGPVLLLRLAGRQVSQPAVLAAVAAGFGLTVILHLFPNAPGDWIERLVPFAVSFGIALIGKRGGR